MIQQDLKSGPWLHKSHAEYGDSKKNTGYRRGNQHRFTQVVPGTFAGNICNAVPRLTAPALLVREAEVKLKGPGGERSVPINEFFVGPRKPVIRSDEIVTEISVPKPPVGGKGIYLKHSQRHAMDLALVGVAVYAVKEGDTCKDIRIGLGAVAPTPYRAAGAEEMLRGKKITPELIDEAPRCSNSAAIDDHRFAEYAAVWSL